MHTYIKTSIQKNSITLLNKNDKSFDYQNDTNVNTVDLPRMLDSLTTSNSLLDIQFHQFANKVFC